MSTDNSTPENRPTRPPIRKPYTKPVLTPMRPLQRVRHVKCDAEMFVDPHWMGLTTVFRFASEAGQSLVHCPLCNAWLYGEMKQGFVWPMEQLP